MHTHSLDTRQGLPTAACSAVRLRGASAGAVNAVVFAVGMIDGRAKAKAGLARF